MSTVEENLSELRKDIAPCKAKIIAVTKYFGAEKLIEAYQDGLRDFAENRVQDALDKFGKLPEEIKQNSTFHLIGHLQTNKVKKAVGYFDYIQSVDSLRLARMISETALDRGIVQKILLQVNNANEANKSGFSKNDLKAVFSDIISLEGLDVRGLMNIAPVTSEDELDILFADMNSFKKELEAEYGYELPELSMGMSNDYKKKKKNGSTMIRVGRKLFL